MKGDFKAIYDSILVEPAAAGSIVIPEHGTWAYVSEDELLCYTGVCMNWDREVLLEMSPYYMVGKHSYDKKVKEKIHGFFRLAQGAIYLDDYIDQYHDEAKQFKRLPIQLKLPSGGDTGYGIYQTEEFPAEFNAEIERCIFGVTADELQSFLTAYARLIGRCDGYFQFPRLTRYQRSDNSCDLCGMWIPRSFPYLIFEESGFDFSHVSLWGAYRYFQLLLQNRSDSRTAGLLMDEGVEETVIKNILRIRTVPGIRFNARQVTDGLLRFMNPEE